MCVCVCVCACDGESECVGVRASGCEVLEFAKFDVILESSRGTEVCACFCVRVCVRLTAWVRLRVSVCRSTCVRV